MKSIAFKSILVLSLSALMMACMVTVNNQDVNTRPYVARVRP